MPGLMLLLALTLNGDDRGPGKDKQPPPAPRVEESRLDTVLQWNEHALEAIRRDRTAPPLAARNLAIVHAAVADAINVVHQKYKAFYVTRRAVDGQAIDADVAAAVTAQRVLAGLYPKQASRLERILDRALDAIPAGNAKSRGVSLGHWVARRYLDWRRDDTRPRGTSYRPSFDIGLWRPTPPGHASALMPGWGKTRPFGVRDVRGFRPKAPPKLTSAEYAEDFNEVKALGNRDSLKRSAEQTIIACFWAGGTGTCTPPGQWNRIAREVALDQGLMQWETARLFALLNIALADAGIVCWDCKFHYRLWRPVTAIHEADRDGNPDTHRDPRWESLLTTPPFPSYTSGHSTFSGAAAAILEKFFGHDDVAFTVGSDDMPGTYRSFKGFREAADEAGRSRIYGGIHYECDNREGLRLGRAVAEEVFRSRLQLDQLEARRPRRKPRGANATPLAPHVSVRRERP